MISTLKRLVTGAFELVYGGYAVIAFVVLAFLCLVMILLPLGIDARRAITHWFSRVLFVAIGIRIRLQNAERLPEGACVVVANHASYLDGIVMKAALPARFSFVIKKEVSNVPLGGLLLKRIGSEFVDRANRHAGARDARRLMKAAERGQALVFFPEGTFIDEPGVGKFHSGAFAIAARANLPVVPVAIQGTRRMLPASRWLPRPGRATIMVRPAIGPLAGEDAVATTRELSRAEILKVVGEPDIADGPGRSERSETTAA
jgi:1-acyl-sn-glycerol-3-phosphate acyltransferase